MISTPLIEYLLKNKRRIMTERYFSYSHLAKSLFLQGIILQRELEESIFSSDDGLFKPPPVSQSYFEAAFDILEAEECFDLDESKKVLKDSEKSILKAIGFADKRLKANSKGAAIYFSVREEMIRKNISVGKAIEIVADQLQWSVSTIKKYYYPLKEFTEELADLLANEQYIKTGHYPEYKDMHMIWSPETCQFWSLLSTEIQQTIEHTQGSMWSYIDLGGSYDRLERILPTIEDYAVSSKLENERIMALRKLIATNT
ncbi:hypothetical protein [uncultured Photobacterium sp.]|uniref:hypothetical protein n=1 Tax=uncultured Photobacterium sp. TaxID=173973 RepID=UPI002633E45B|nr:hypothetical protein [uncultured Photobacterium sp.]